MWRFPRTVSDQPLVFVVGAPRSGTTLLQRVIATHSKFVSIDGETGIFSARNIFDRPHFHLSDEDTRALLASSKDIVDLFARGVALLESRSGGATFVEKTPQHVKHLPFLVKHFPQAKFVHIIRDGRDCYCSAQHHPNIPQRNSVRTFASYWRRCIRSSDQIAGHPSLATLYYQDFTDNPRRELTRIMGHLGVEVEDAQLDPGTTGLDARSGLAHFSRLSQAVTGETVGRWRQEMSEKDAGEFERVAGHELRQHGYQRLSA